VAVLIECGVVQIVLQIGKPTAVDSNGGSRDPAAAAVNGRALFPPDYKVGAEVQQGAGVDVRGEVDLLGQ
jgi:hypothetical protein